MKKESIRVSEIRSYETRQALYEIHTGKGPEQFFRAPP
jgi:hypothetical protein